MDERPRAATPARRVAALALVAVMASLLALASQPVAAHAVLASSDPPDNAVLSAAPSDVRLRFTEPVEELYTSAQLYDATGQQLTTEPSYLDPSATELVLPLPAALPVGTYTVQWRNISAADGHPLVGLVSFTIGDQSNVVQAVAPAAPRFGRAPRWLDATGRWFGALGVVAMVGALVTWLLVIEPTLRSGAVERVPVVRARLIWLERAAVALALAGSAIALVVQARNVGAGVNPHDLETIIRSTRYGRYWLLRVGFLIGLSVLYPSPALWTHPPRRGSALLAVCFGVATLVTFAEISHAAALAVGQQAALMVDGLHLLGAAVWVGGLLALTVGLIGGLRGLSDDTRRTIYARAIPRFSTLAIASLAALTLTGIYSAWLQVGSWHALRATTYGRALLIKVGITALMVALGAVNQRVLAPSLATSARAGARLGRAIATEATLGVAVLLVVGVLTSLPTAREAVETPAGQAAFSWSQAGLRAQLTLTPGTVGVNRYTVDISSSAADLPAETQVILRVAPASGLEGVRDIALTPVGTGRFDASGSELSVTGAWQLALIVRRPNLDDWQAQTSANIGTTPPSAAAGPPPRFAGSGSAGAVLAAGVGAVLAIVALRESRARRRWTGVGIGVALVLLAGMVLAANRVTHEPTALQDTRWVAPRDVSAPVQRVVTSWDA